jgi:hypothetical protein
VLQILESIFLFDNHIKGIGSKINPTDRQSFAEAASRKLHSLKSKMTISEKKQIMLKLGMK